MDEGTKTIALGPRSRKAMTGDENQNCVVAVVANKIQNRAETVQYTEKLIRSTQSRRRKLPIVIARDDDDIDLR